MNNNYSSFYAGLMSGIVSNTVCTPFDVIRTNQQLNKPVIYNMRFLNRGIMYGFITIPTFWSVYFETYNSLQLNVISRLNFLNGFIASCVASTVTCPLWFIRQRYQVLGEFDIIKYYNKYGISSFYKGLFTTYIINGSFIIQMPLYEYLKKNEILQEKLKNDTFKIFIITSISKTGASIVFYPLDTIRTIIRNSENVITINNSIKFNESTFSNMKNIILSLNINPKNYYYGIRIYLMRSIPYHTTTFCTYEYVKKILENT